MAQKLKGAKRAKGSTHSVGPTARGMAGFAACGAYVLMSKQTAKREEVGCRACWEIIQATTNKEAVR